MICPQASVFPHSPPPPNSNSELCLHTSHYANSVSRRCPQATVFTHYPSPSNPNPQLYLRTTESCLSEYLSRLPTGISLFVLLVLYIMVKYHKVVLLISVKNH